MPLVPYDDSVSPNFLAPVQPPRPETGPSIMDAAFKRQNPVVGAADWLTEPRFRADLDNFSFEDRAKTSEAFKIRPRSFNQVLSNEEWDWMEMKVLREAAERRVLDQAGVAGIAAQMFAGLLSPTILLPVGSIAAGGSVAGTAGRTAAWAALGAAVDESVLYSQQELRTGEEVAFGIGTAAVLGGLLGSAARYLTKGDYDTFKGDMVGGNPPMTIQPGAAPSALEGRVLDADGNEVGAARMPAAGDPAQAQGFSEAYLIRLEDTRTRILSDIEGVEVFDGALWENFIEGGALAEEFAALGIKSVEDLQRIAQNPASFQPTPKQLAEYVRKAKSERSDYEPTLPGRAEDYLENNAPLDAVRARIEERGRSFDFLSDPDPDIPENIFRARRVQAERDEILTEAEKYLEDTLPSLEEFRQIFAAMPKANDLIVERLMRRVEEENPKEFLEAIRGGQSVTKALDDLLIRVLDDVGGETFGRLNKQKMLEADAVDNQRIEDEAKAILASGPRSLSAAAVDPETLAEMGIRADTMTAERPLNVGINRAVKWLGPVTRQLENAFSPTTRWFQAQLSTAGLYLNDATKGISAAPKGEVKELVAMHHYKLYAVINRQKEYWKAAKRDNPELRKMTVKQFDEAVGYALSVDKPTGFKEADDVAQIYREELFLPMLKEFQAARFPGFDNIDPEEAMSYFPRVLRQGMVSRDEETFLEIMTQNFEEGLRARAQAKINTVEARIDKMTQEADDVELDQAGAEALRADLEAQIARLPQEFGGKIEEIASEIRALRRFARAAKGKEAAQFRQEAKDLEDANKELLKGFRKKENAIKGRFRTLDKTRAQLEKRQEEVLGRIEKIEDMQLDTIQSAMRRGQKLLTKMQGTEGKFSAEAVKLRTQIEKAFATYAKGEERLDKMLSANRDDFMQLADSDLIPTEKVSILARRQADRAQGLERLMDDLSAIERGAPKAEVEAALTRALDNLAIAARNTNNKRAERIAKLRERAAELDPAKAKLKADELRGRATKARTDLGEELETRLGMRERAGADIRWFRDFRQQFNNLDFAVFAREMAEDMKMKMTGESGRTPALAFLEERGSQLARTLKIDMDREWQTSTGLRKAREFYEQDVEKVARRYLRTMAPDLELFKRFGTVNPMTNGSELFGRIRTEFDEAKKQVRDNPKLSEKAKAEKLEQIQSAFRQTMLDFDGEIQRLRHTTGMSSDPNAFGYRLGRFALNLNTIRLMGMVVISSLPDLGSIILKHGLTRSLGTGFKYFTDMKTFKATREEARYAGIGLDVALGSRSSALFDIIDETEHGLAVERGLQHLTNNFGKFALFDYWNREVKSLAAAIMQTRIAKGLKDYAEGTISKQEIAFLAASGIDDINARRMWREMTETEGGADMVSGALLPNSKYWSDPELGRVYRAAIARITNSTIVTPGLERPLWMDGSMWGRIIGQFRSFTFASTQRIVMVAAQDARLGNVAQVGIGTISMLALGGLSYYLTARFKGGDFREEMENASLDKWAFEAVIRSGILGVLSEAQITAERIPWTQDYSTFGTEQSNRTIFNRPILNALGPSVGLIGDAEQVLVTLGDPNRGTIDAARRLTPFNNVFWGLRQMFDELEKEAADVLGVAP